MEGKLFIREFSVLSGDGAAKHFSPIILFLPVLLRCVAVSLEHSVCDRRGCIEDVGDVVEFFHGRASQNKGEEVHLGDKCAPHSWCPHERNFQ
jgi:hypothetical protein